MSAYSTLVLASSPVVYYRLGESTGTTAVDSSGHGINGTYIGTFTLGEAGAIKSDPDTAVLFGPPSAPGGAGLVAVSANAALLLPIVTYEAWFKTTDVQGDTIISANAFGGSYFIMVQVTATGQVEAQTPWLSSLTSPLSYNDAGWHLMNLTYDGTTETLYIDGAAVASGMGTPTAISGTPQLFLAERIDTDSNNFFGVLDEVAIYPTALSPATITAHYNNKVATMSAYSTLILAGNPVAYYRLGESSGTVAVDSSGNSQTGTYSGTFTLGEPGAIKGDPNTCVLFVSSGDGQMASVLNTTPLAVDTYTSEAWVKLVSLTSAAGAIRPGVGHYGFLFVEGDFYDGNAVLIEAGTFTTGQWYHVVTVCSPTGTLGYINGVLVGSTATVMIDCTTDFLLANAFSNFLDGFMDEAALYNYGLSPAQILAHYNLGKNGKPPTGGSFFAWWGQLDE